MVVETTGALTYVGRFDSEDATGVHLLDVGVHDAASAGSKDEYVRGSARFGIRTERKHLVVPRSEISRITRLGDVE
ncbi:MAG TPA: hypothetical protein VHG35_17025 [Gemmatimonadales bacterium]|nr:hypothetical protein [Gemmatimonadales bacterium]